MGDNPLFVKQLQMLVVTLIGAGVCGLGIWLLYKQMTAPRAQRAGDIEVEGLGLKIKIVRSLPGAVIALLGGTLIYWSLNAGGERKVRQVTEAIPDERAPAAEALLPVWLANATPLTGREEYFAVIKAITAGANFRAENKVLTQPQTLEALAAEKYRDKRYWLLVAKINASRGYYDLDSLRPTLPIPTGSVVEFWFPVKNSKRVTTYEEFVKVRGNDVRGAYDQLLQMIGAGLVASEQQDRELTATFRPQELGYVISVEETDGQTTLNELALKYYRDKKYGVLIRWRNRSILPAALRNGDPIPKGTQLLIPNFLP